jgi:hypothetical protein
VIKQVLLVVVAFIVAGGFFQKAQAQILDDTTKNVYGPRSTWFILESDVAKGLDTLYLIDTNLTNIHLLEEFTWKPNRILQNLGNIGTATQPLYFELPTQIGRRLGIDIFTPYAYNNAEIHYLNTYSPTTYAQYLQGGNGRQILKAGFSQNVNSRLNVGFDIKSISSQKQIGTPTAEEREASHSSVLFFTSFTSKDSLYKVFANYSFMNHGLAETGGVLPTANDTTSNKALVKNNLFDFEQERGRLSTNSLSREFRYSFRVYQEYNVKKLGLVVFHRYSYNRQKNSFSDPDAQNSSLYSYRQTANPNLDTGIVLFTDELKFQENEHTLGIRRNWRWFAGSFWAKTRTFDYVSYFNNYKGSYRTETWIGGNVELSPFKNATLNTTANYILGRDYELRSVLKIGKFGAGIELLNWSATLQQLDYRNAYLNWQNDFKNQSAQHLFAFLHLGKDKANITFKGNLQTLQNLVYFSADASPKQSSDLTSVLSIEVNPTLKAGKFVFENQVKYTTVNGSDIIRVPELLVWSKWYYQGRLFNNALHLQAGLDVRYRSAWLSNAYLPYLNNWVVQDRNAASSFEIPGSVSIMPFVSAEIGRATLFVRFSNALQGVGGSNGFWESPFYPGQRRTFGFGVRWMFFD